VGKIVALVIHLVLWIRKRYISQEALPVPYGVRPHVGKGSDFLSALSYS